MTPRRIGPSDDLAAILSLIRAAFAGMEGRIDPPSSMHALTEGDIALQAVEGEVWAIGDPPVACVFLTPRPASLYLGKLAVRPGRQGQGLGRRLVGVAEGRARAMGLRMLELSTRVELVENHAAFRAMGFAQTGSASHPGFDRITTLVFTKPVAPRNVLP